MHPCRRGNRQDDDDHAPDRVAGGERRLPARANRGGDVHRQGGGRAPRAAARARRRTACAPRPSTRRRSRCSATSKEIRAGSSPRRRPLLRRIGNALPGAFRFRPAGDLATEIEWAKNRRLTPDTYRDWLGDHEPPIPPDLSLRVFREYERRKDAEGLLDFEDLLERTARLLESDDGARAAVHDRWRAFTVDEYQDVNLLQQSLLDLWLGDRDDLCAVGDDYQAIYGFTGASAEWLLALPRRFPRRPRRAARAELPLDRAGDRAGESARAAARRLGEDARADASGRPRAGGRAGAERRRRTCGSCTPRGCRSRRWPCSCAPTRARASSRRRSTRPGSRSRARRCWRATRPASC